jgi:hypothetical protein
LYCLGIRPRSCISLLFLHILWVNVLIIERERRESSGFLVHRGSEREERDCEVVHSGTLYFPFTEYNIDKVPVDVAAFLVSEPRKISVYCVWLCYVHA